VFEIELNQDLEMPCIILNFIHYCLSLIIEKDGWSKREVANRLFFVLQSGSVFELTFK
jgi:hypothetical protein